MLGHTQVTRAWMGRVWRQMTLWKRDQAHWMHQGGRGEGGKQREQCSGPRLGRGRTMVALSILHFLRNQRVQVRPGIAEEALCSMLGWSPALTSSPSTLHSQILSTFLETGSHEAGKNYLKALTLLFPLAKSWDPGSTMLGLHHARDGVRGLACPANWATALPTEPQPQPRISCFSALLNGSGPDGCVAGKTKKEVTMDVCRHG